MYRADACICTTHRPIEVSEVFDEFRYIPLTDRKDRVRDSSTCVSFIPYRTCQAMVIIVEIRRTEVDVFEMVEYVFVLVTGFKLRIGCYSVDDLCSKWLVWVMGLYTGCVGGYDGVSIRDLVAIVVTMTFYPFHLYFNLSID